MSKAEMDRMSDLIGKLQRSELSNMPNHLRCPDVNGGEVARTHKRAGGEQVV